MEGEELNQQFSEFDLASSTELFIKHKNMSEEEMVFLLSKKTWTILEMIHFSLGKTIEFSQSYLWSENMDFLSKTIPSTLQPVEVGKKKHYEAFAKIGESIVVKAKVVDDASLYSVEEYLEWAINSLAFPKRVHAQLSVFIPEEYLFEECGFSDYGLKFLMRERDIKNPQRQDSERVVKQKVVAQVLAFEKGLSIKEIESHPLMMKCIPEGKYWKGSRRMRENIVEIVPKKPRGRPSKDQRSNFSLHPLNCIFGASSTHIELPIFKLVVTTISGALKTLSPKITREEIRNHSLIRLYLKCAPTIVQRMYDRWLSPLISN